MSSDESSSGENKSKKEEKAEEVGGWLWGPWGPGRWGAPGLVAGQTDNPRRRGNEGRVGETVLLKA